ncbi:hypothetical protein [Aureimonas sp. Leaf324]|uniref:hypothetical protein n=1 Tax=Aureimonas sp. Leaf324 TaxID=1736336 RepID=UPI0006F6CD30|nr:hypothetical protein [Aureimonas sp. Leaf324]KQQ86061.1 hypothetical protein ASF65_05950 [Aureimonas sp. Leaf324]
MTTENDMPNTFGEDNETNAAAAAAAQASAVGDAGDAGHTRAREKKTRRPKRVKKVTRGKAAAKAPKEPKEKAKAKPKKVAFDIDALAPEVRAIVEESAAIVEAIGRKTTKNVFDLGAAFAVMQEAIPDLDHWKAAVVQRCRTSWKFADNWAKVHTLFGERRAEFIQHQVTPTVLIHLIPASAGHVDHVLASFAAGQPMKVAEVKVLVKSDTAVVGEAGSERKGGAKGLRAFGAAKLARQGKSVTDGLKAIRQVLGSSLKAAGRKRLEKGKLAKELVPVARQTHRELTEMLCDIDPASLGGGQAVRHLPLEDTGWAAVLRLLNRLASAEAWPDATDVKDWIGGEIAEVLAFALDGVECSASGNDGEAAEVADETDGELHAVADNGSADDGAQVVLEKSEGRQPDETTAVEAASEVAERPVDGAEASLTVTDSAAAKPGPSSEAAAAPKFRQFQPNRRTIIPGLLSADPSMPTGRPNAAPGTHGTAR